MVDVSVAHSTQYRMLYSLSTDRGLKINLIVKDYIRELHKLPFTAASAPLMGHQGSRKTACY